MSAFVVTCFHALLTAAAPGADAPLSATDVLQRVDAFYTTSWNRLVVFTAVLIGVVGVVAPVLLVWASSRLFKHEEDAIAGRVEARVRADFEKLSTKLAEDLATREKRLMEEIAGASSKLDQQMTSLEKRNEGALSQQKAELSKALTRGEAGIFHVQGNERMRAGEFGFATYSLAVAIQLEAEAADGSNLARALINLRDLCLPRIGNAEFEAVPDLDEKLSKAIKAVETYDRDHVFADTLQQLKVAIQKAKQRAPTGQLEIPKVSKPGT